MTQVSTRISFAKHHPGIIVVIIYLNNCLQQASQLCKHVLKPCFPGTLATAGKRDTGKSGATYYY